MRKPKRKRNKKPAYSSEQVARIIPLLEEWTRYEIAARLLPLQTNLCIDYYRRMLEKEDEIRYLLYGSSDLPTLAKLLGMDKSEDEVEIRPKRSDSPFVPDKKRLRKQVKQEGRSVKSEVGIIDDDIEAILLAAGVS